VFCVARVFCVVARVLLRLSVLSLGVFLLSSVIFWSVDLLVK